MGRSICGWKKWQSQYDTCQSSVWIQSIWILYLWALSKAWSLGVCWLLFCKASNDSLSRTNDVFVVELNNWGVKANCIKKTRFKTQTKAPFEITWKLSSYSQLSLSLSFSQSLIQVVHTFLTYFTLLFLPSHSLFHNLDCAFTPTHTHSYTQTHTLTPTHSLSFQFPCLTFLSLLSQ